jgi:hypothetical protein
MKIKSNPGLGEMGRSGRMVDLSAGHYVHHMGDYACLRIHFFTMDCAYIALRRTWEIGRET